MAGSLAAFSIAGTSTAVTSALSPAGAKKAHQTPQKFCQYPNCGSVGISGNSGNLLDITIPLRPPLFKWPVIVPRAGATASTCPPKTAVTAGDAPLYGIMVSPTP